jgi:hypothetical protein
MTDIIDIGFHINYNHLQQDKEMSEDNIRAHLRSLSSPGAPGGGDRFYAG